MRKSRNSIGVLLPSLLRSSSGRSPMKEEVTSKEFIKTDEE
jgi:hypothetical protein